MKNVIKKSLKVLTCILTLFGYEFKSDPNLMKILSHKNPI